MRKLILFLTGLFFTALQSIAQQPIGNITQNVIRNIDQLTTGYYLINCNLPQTAASEESKPSGSLYFNPSRMDRPFNVDRDGFIFAEKTTVSAEQANYLWFIQNDNGVITVKNFSSGYYLPVDASRNSNMSQPQTKEKATFTGVDKTITDAGDREITGIVLKYSNETVTDAPWTILSIRLPIQTRI